MKSFLSFVNSKLPYTGIAIGKFDGMHKAHIKLLNLIADNGCALNITSHKLPFVTPPRERERYVNLPFYSLRFENIKDWDSIDFLKLLFLVLPNLKKIAVGYDFCFGKDKMSNTKDMIMLLKNINKEYVKLDVLDSQKYNGKPIHTSIIKELIKCGDMKNVNAMLGRFYSISGKTIKGQGIGKSNVYPTINIQNTLYVTPKHGVYATFAIYNNKVYEAISFVGNRLSTDNKFCIETHIIDLKLASGYGDNFKILFIEFLRDNMRFDELLKLKEQINKDIEYAKIILSQVKNSQAFSFV